MQITAFNSRNYYDCVKFKHRINDYSKINQLMNNDLIHFNERKKICFDKIEQEEVEMRLC